MDDSASSTHFQATLGHLEEPPSKSRAQGWGFAYAVRQEDDYEAIATLCGRMSDQEAQGRERERERERQTDRQADRQADRHIKEKTKKKYIYIYAVKLKTGPRFGVL